MPSSSIAAFNDPLAFEAALQRGCSVEMLVTGQGRFRAELISIVLPRLRLLKGRERLSRSAVVSVSPASLLVLLQTESGHSQVCDGICLRADEIMTVSAGERLHLWTHGPCDWGIVSVSARELASYGQAFVGRNFSVAGGVARLRPSRESLQSLMTLFGAAIRLTEAKPSIPIKTDGATRGLEQQLIQVILGCLSTAAVQANEMARQCHDTMVRLEDFLRSRQGELLKVPEICSALGIPDKTLQACCLRHMGISVNRYLRLHAMRRVYNELVLAHPKATSISQVAKRHGFTSSGRFAAAYQQQFGEYPSATLLREPT